MSKYTDVVIAMDIAGHLDQPIRNILTHYVYLLGISILQESIIQCCPQGCDLGNSLSEGELTF